MSNRDHETSNMPRTVSPPPRPKRKVVNPPPRPNRDVASPPRRPRSSPALRTCNISNSKRTLIVCGLGFVGLVMLVVAARGVSALPVVWGPSSTTSVDYTSIELREVIRLLREDPACRDTRLGDDYFRPSNVSLELWEHVLGQPTSTMGRENKPYWTYLTSDGGVTLHVEVDSRSGEVPFVIVNDNGDAVGIKSNKRVDSEALKQTIIAIKSRIDSGDSLALAQKLQKQWKKESGELERQWKERERQEELARQQSHEDAIRKRDLEYKAAKALAKKLFHDARVAPQFMFAEELGVGEASIVPSENTKELIEVMRKGKEQDDWAPLLRFLDIGFGTFHDGGFSTVVDNKFTQSHIKSAYRQLLHLRDFQPHRFMVFVATSTDLGSATMFYSAVDHLEETDHFERHLSKVGWLLPWSPFMGGAFLAPDNSDTSEAYWAAREKIDQAIAKIRQRKDLGEEIPNEDQLIRDVVRKQYTHLKQKVLGEPVATSDSMPRPTPAANPSKANQTLPKTQKSSPSNDAAPKDSKSAPTNQQDDAEKIRMALNKRVSLIKPYPTSYDGARRDRISIQFAVRDIARQAGLKYDFETSFKNTDPTCRQWIYPRFRNQRCRDALRAILQPFGLKYRIEKGEIILERR